MSNTQRTLLFFALPALAPLIYPPDWLAWIISGNGVAGIITLLLVVALFVGLGYLLLRGYSTALTLSIFLQGLNVIVRTMMLLPKVAFSDGSLNVPYILASVISIGLSMYLLLRLDRVDVRTTMVR